MSRRRGQETCLRLPSSLRSSRRFPEPRGLLLAFLLQVKASVFEVDKGAAYGQRNGSKKVIETRQRHPVCFPILFLSQRTPQLDSSVGREGLLRIFIVKAHRCGNPERAREKMGVAGKSRRWDLMPGGPAGTEPSLGGRQWA